MIDAQKKEVAILWAQEDYETADKETSIAKERAKEAIDKAESELAAHLADTVPYTSDSARRNVRFRICRSSSHSWGRAMATEEQKAVKMGRRQGIHFLGQRGIRKQVVMLTGKTV